MTGSVLVLFLVSIWALPSLHASLNPPPADLGGEKRDFSETARRTQWFSDGGLERSQINVLSSLRPLVKELKEKAAKGGGNLAHLRPARCLSLRGTQLPMQRECADSWLAATDGDPCTYIRGRMEWPWQLEVDLGQEQPFGRVRVRYRQGEFATRVLVSASSDGETWQTLAERDNTDSVETLIEFRPIRARYLRYAALKPNGPNQEGVQMAISEIDIR